MRGNILKSISTTFILSLLSLVILCQFVGCVADDDDDDQSARSPIRVPIPPANDITFIKTYGGFDMDQGKSVLQTDDGGYFFCGSTQSSGSGSSDIYLVKTDDSGNEEWSSTYGGPEPDIGEAAVQTSDGGFIITGSTLSYGSSSKGFLLKTDNSGNSEWFETFDKGWGYSVQQTNDGGYVVTGVYNSDIFLLKTDSRGNEIWYQIFASPHTDYGYSVQQTHDGGYIICGEWDSFSPYGRSYLVLIKTDQNGNLEWLQPFGNGNYYATGYSVFQTSDGGYIAGGNMIVKTDGMGNEMWSKDGPGFVAYSVQETRLGEYVFCGYNYGSGNPGDVSILKTDNMGNQIWQNSYGGPEYESGYSLQQTKDDGFILCGITYSYGAGDIDIYVIKTDSDGKVKVS